MNATLNKTLGQVEVREPVSHGSLHLFALTGGPSEEQDLTLLDDALEEGYFRVEELGESGSVPELRVINGGVMPVLVLEGDELIGAKQNRVVNSSVLVAAASELVLPVSCVERGRWSYRSRAFASGDGSPHVSLRRLKSRAVRDSLQRGAGHRSDQGAVWEEVDRKARAHGAHSPTDALQDARGSLSERLAGFLRLADEMPEDARGVVVALGRRPVLAELLAGPRSFAKAFPRLLSGYAFEALEHAGDGPAPGVKAAERFLAQVARARREEHPAVGLGRDVRFESELISGYSLLGEGRVLHAAAFAG